MSRKLSGRNPELVPLIRALYESGVFRPKLHLAYLLNYSADYARLGQLDLEFQGLRPNRDPECGQFWAFLKRPHNRTVRAETLHVSPCPIEETAEARSSRYWQ